jgi:hypothetical protein
MILWPKGPTGKSHGRMIWWPKGPTGKSRGGKGRRADIDLLGPLTNASEEMRQLPIEDAVEEATKEPESKKKIRDTEELEAGRPRPDGAPDEFPGELVSQEGELKDSPEAKGDIRGGAHCQACLLEEEGAVISEKRKLSPGEEGKPRSSQEAREFEDLPCICCHLSVSSRL